MSKLFNPFEDTMPEYLDDFTARRGYAERRNYVMERMVSLAREEKLYLTGLMILGPNVKDIVGDIIFGRSIQNNQQRSGEYVPQEIEDYKVSLITYKEFESGKKDAKSGIEWKDGRIIDRRAVLRNSMAKNRNSSYSVDRPVFKSRPSGKFSMQQAYKVLKQNGCWVRYGEEHQFFPGAVLEELPSGMLKK
jgi:hypothetical protein